MPTLITPPSEPSYIFDNLRLGTIWNAKNLILKNPGYGLVLNCSTEAVRVPRGVCSFQLGLAPAGLVPFEKMRFAVKALHGFFQDWRGRSALVCCLDAVSLSPAIVLAYLMASGMCFEEATETLIERHRATDISPAILESVLTCFG